MVTAEAFEAYKAETIEESTLVARASLVIEAIARMEGVSVDKAEMEEQKVRAALPRTPPTTNAPAAAQRPWSLSDAPTRAIVPPRHPLVHSLRAQLMMKASDPKGMEKVDDAMLMTQIEATLLREKVLELVASRATIDKVPMQEAAE